jgi:phage terminase large subunit
MSQILKVSTGYTPRPFQEELHAKLKRFNVLVCHRRFGKTVFAINEKIDRGLRNPLKNPQYAYFAPYYGQAKRVAWDYLKEYTKNIRGVTTNEADLRVDIPRPHLGDRLRFMLLGADNPGAIRGIYLDGATLDEYAEMDPLIWSQVIRPALSDRIGWASFIGTPKGQNHFYDIYKKALTNPEWFAALFKASQTGVLPESELRAARETMTPEEYEQEFECSFQAALMGAYYGKEMEKAEREKRIGFVPYDPAVPVETWWDLGIDDSTAIWFIQQVGREYHAIDYIEESGQALTFFAKAIQARSYVYSGHNLPHDAAARELSTGKTRQESLKPLLGNVRTIVHPRHEVEDGIHASRMVLSKCWFDAVKCERGINALKSYERKYDAKNKIYQARPFHNWASHGADAFRLFSMGHRDKSEVVNSRTLPRQADTAYDVLG